MNTLLYYRDMFIPTNIAIGKLLNECKSLNITYDKLNAIRSYRFYSKDESNIRYIKTKHILKTI